MCACHLDTTLTPVNASITLGFSLATVFFLSNFHRHCCDVCWQCMEKMMEDDEKEDEGF